MNYQQAGIKQFLTSVLALFAAGVCSAQTNTVTREIRYENGDIWVQDSIHLALQTWAGTPLLQDLLAEKRKKGPNFTGLLQQLYSGEDLTIIKYESDMAGIFMDLHVRSKARIDFAKPARLRCLPTYGGASFKLTSAGESSEPYL